LDNSAIFALAKGVSVEGPAQAAISDDDVDLGVPLDARDKDVRVATHDHANTSLPAACK